MGNIIDDNNLLCKVVILPLLIAVTLLMFFSTTIAATSLWTDDAESMYQDRSSFEEGDIITINIEESASALQSASTDTSQSSGMEVETRMGILNFLASLLVGYSEDDSADGRTGREGNFEANITTQVVEVLENGNLRVEGTKNLTINEEDQEIGLNGIVRPEDISLENEISSRKVADATIEFKGEGVVGDKQRPGLFSRLFNWLL